MKWFKKPSADDLDAQLRARRAQPGDEFTRSVARRITPEPRPALGRPRFALAGGLGAVTLTVFALAGGVGAAHDAVGSTASLVQTSFFHDGHSSHPGEGHGQPGDDQYGNDCDHLFDHFSNACNNHGGGDGNGDHGNGDHGHGGNQGGGDKGGKGKSGGHH
jgi:hypothetical protein